MTKNLTIEAMRLLVQQADATAREAEVKMQAEKRMSCSHEIWEYELVAEMGYYDAVEGFSLERICKACYEKQLCSLPRYDDPILKELWQIAK